MTDAALRLVTPRPSRSPEELNLRILQPLFRYVRRQFGDQALSRIAERAGIPIDFFDRASAWVSHGQFEAVLAATRALVKNDQEFQQAAAYELAAVYGPMLLVLRCMSIRSAYEMMVKTIHLVSKISHYEIVRATNTSIRLRYTSRYRDSRLLCLSRKAQLAAGPTVYWGVAPARIEEVSCIAHGDAACEYKLRWYQPIRWRWPLTAGLLGLSLAWVPMVGLSPWPIAGVFGLSGVLIGLLIEQRRVMADHQAFAEQTNHELEHVVQAHAHAVDEVLALHQREREWNRQLEQQMALRSARLDEVVQRLETLGELRRDKVRSLSHDINNPLTVLHGISLQLHQHGTRPDDIDEIASTLENTVDHVSKLVRELAMVVRDDPAPPHYSVEQIQVGELTDRIRRQLRAMVVGRDIRTTVFQTREAPTLLETAPVMMERIIDNILTNAAKYTEQGSIIVEVGGTPGHLVLKVSDTGRGMATQRLEQVLRAPTPDPNPPRAGSHGVGLSIVARILDQLGGRLEIMSEPGEGTTAWVYLPARTSNHRPNIVTTDPIEGIIERVVKIRPKHRLGDEVHDR